MSLIILLLSSDLHWLSQRIILWQRPKLINMCQQHIHLKVTPTWESIQSDWVQVDFLISDHRSFQLLLSRWFLLGGSPHPTLLCQPQAGAACQPACPTKTPSPLFLHTLPAKLTYFANLSACPTKTLPPYIPVFFRNHPPQRMSSFSKCSECERPVFQLNGKAKSLNQN